MGRRTVLLLLVLCAGCGGAPVPDRATSEAQLRARMAAYNLGQVTPGSGERMCSYMTPDSREAWKDDDNAANRVMRDLLPASVVDCESYWENLIATISGSPAVAERVRTDQITAVTVNGETATTTLSFGGTFNWRWEDGQWLLSGHA